MTQETGLLFARKHNPWTFRLSVLLIPVIAYVDYITPEDLAFYLFYIPPIAAVVWYGKRRHAYMITVIACIAWLLGKEFWAIPIDFIFQWNAGVRFLTFWLTALVFLRLRTYTEHLEDFQAKLEESLRKEQVLSREDTLTGALNRRAFHEHLEAERHRSERYGTQFSLLYLDIDKFKTVNDTLGHAYGDEVLQKVSGAIRKHIRKTDFLGRLGGDEFAVLLPETAASGAEATAHHILKALSQLEPPVSSSVGIASFVKCSFDNSKCITAADQAMYEAKQQGPGRISFAKL